MNDSLRNPHADSPLQSGQTVGNVPPICRRCHGLMVVEPSYVMTESDTAGATQQRRCLNCGDVDDTVISSNRLEIQRANGLARHAIVLDICLGPGESAGRRKLKDGSRRCL